MDQRFSIKDMNGRVEEKEEVIQRLTQELEDVKNFMDSIIQSIGSGIIITGINDVITYINRAGERILGFSQNELVSQPFSIFGLREKESDIRSFFL